MADFFSGREWGEGGINLCLCRGGVSDLRWDKG